MLDNSTDGVTCSLCLPVSVVMTCVPGNLITSVRKRWARLNLRCSSYHVRLICFCPPRVVKDYSLFNRMSHPVSVYVMTGKSPKSAHKSQNSLLPPTPNCYKKILRVTNKGVSLTAVNYFRVKSISGVCLHQLERSLDIIPLEAVWYNSPVT